MCSAGCDATRPGGTAVSDPAAAKSACSGPVLVAARGPVACVPSNGLARAGIRTPSAYSSHISPPRGVSPPVFRWWRHGALRGWSFRFVSVGDDVCSAACRKSMWRGSCRCAPAGFAFTCWGLPAWNGKGPPWGSTSPFVTSGLRWWHKRRIAVGCVIMVPLRSEHSAHGCEGSGNYGGCAPLGLTALRVVGVTTGGLLRWSRGASHSCTVGYMYVCTHVQLDTSLSHWGCGACLERAASMYRGCSASKSCMPGASTPLLLGCYVYPLRRLDTCTYVHVSKCTIVRYPREGHLYP